MASCWRSTFILAVTAALPGAVHGQSIATPQPDLHHAMAVAQDNYPAVAIALQRLRSAERGVDVARAEYAPRIDLLYQANRATVNNITGTLLPQSVVPSLSGPPLSERGATAYNSAAGILFSWQPFDFGYRGALVAAAHARAEAADQDVALTRLDVEAATAAAYLNLAAAQRLRNVAEANLQRLSTFRNAVDVLVANKLRAGVEGQIARASEAQAQAVLAQAERDVARHRATLEKLTGETWPATVLTIPKVAYASDGTGGALEQHPMARRGQSLVQAAERDVAATNSSYAPTVSLIGSASARGGGRIDDDRYVDTTAGLEPDTGNWGVGVQLTFPLGSFFSVRARAAQQSANLEAEKLRYRQALADLEERQRQADATLASARELAQIAPEGLAAARLGLDQQEARFRSGLVSSVEVTAAASQLAQAQAQDAIAQIDLLRALIDQAVAQGNMAPFQAAIGGQ